MQFTDQNSGGMFIQFSILIGQKVQLIGQDLHNEHT